MQKPLPIFVLMLLTVLSSCRFSRPAISITTSRETHIDSVHNTVEKITSYRYLAFRKFFFRKGAGRVIRTESDSGKLISWSVSRRSPYKMSDGYVRYKHLTKYYSHNQLDSIVKKIIKFRGRGADGITRIDLTKGKRTRIVQ